MRPTLWAWVMRAKTAKARPIRSRCFMQCSFREGAELAQFHNGMSASESRFVTCRTPLPMVLPFERPVRQGRQNVRTGVLPWTAAQTHNGIRSLRGSGEAGRCPLFRELGRAVRVKERPVSKPQGSRVPNQTERSLPSMPIEGTRRLEVLAHSQDHDVHPDQTNQRDRHQEQPARRP